MVPVAAAIEEAHRRGILHKPLRIDPPIMYPPYDGLKSRLLKLLA